MSATATSYLPETVERKEPTAICSKDLLGASTARYLWAGNLARIAMGKKKVWGEKPQDAANDDPLAWWCLTEAIATSGPK